MKQYHNFKNFYSVILLALVDAKYRFIWASLGAPGNTHEPTLLQSTILWSNVVNGDVLSEAVAKTDDIVIPPLILGDGAFPMRSFLLKPYSDAVLPDKKKDNYRASLGRMVTEGAFGKLKGRWRILSRKCESQKEIAKKMGLAFLVLHNLCIELGDVIPRNWNVTVDHATNNRRPQNEIRDVLLMNNINQKYLGNSPENAKRICDFIASKLWEEKRRNEI